MNDYEIYSERIISYPVEVLYEAFSDPEKLKLWWGPNGFTNTIHEFDLKKGGHWKLTMHGPEVGHYHNESVFKEVKPFKHIGWTRLTQPYFDMEIGFETIDNHQTKISFRMIFATVEECEKIRKFAGPKNEENFDRLQALLDSFAIKTSEN